MALNIRTVEDIKNNFEKYNMILHTSMGTFDTSKFYGCKYINQQNATEIITGNSKALALSYAKELPLNFPTSKPTMEDGSKGKQGIVIITQAILERVTVKSVRNFLENQQKTIKNP